MKINGKDVAVHNAKQWNVTIGNASISSDSTWARGSPVPVLFKNIFGFKTLKIVLIVKGKNREDICQNVSDLLAEMLDTVELELDGFTHHFKGYLTKSTHEETALQRWHKLTLELQTYEFGTVTEQQGKFSGIPAVSMAVRNAGNIITPMRIEITPTAGIASLTISGACPDPETGEDQKIILKNLTTGKTVALDGETGLVTEGEKLKSQDVELWELPAAKPGNTTLTFSTGTLNVTVKMYPRYM